MTTQGKAWKVKKRVYYTRINKTRPERACSRLEISWSAKGPNGVRIDGMGTKRAALATIQDRITRK